MRWLLTFLAGVLIGAIGLFAWLREVPDERPGAQAAAAPALAAPPLAAPNVEGQLPPPPKVEPELGEADLSPKPDGTGAAISRVADVAPGGTQPRLLVPVKGIAYQELSDNFGQPRGKDRRHNALDIMAPKGTPVVATADGQVVKLFTSKPGGLTLYQFDPTGTYAYYYAHLDRYADGIREGMELRRGDLIGYVGSTGNADPKAPHLHFEVIELTPEKQWWQGKPLNPYPLLGD